MLLQTNPGSVVDIQTSDGKFEYVFMALDAYIKGWKYCRPVIVVDATFLKSTYGGMLLTASTQDGNGKIFPLAFAVVDSENHASWEYFFAKLLEAFGRRAGLCIVSDRHDSISEAVKNIFPAASHGICVYHLLNNVKLKFKKKTNAKALRECFHGAAKSYSVQSFDYFMEQLDAVNVAIRPYLEEIGVKKWARAHCTDNRFSTMTSYTAESMNAAIKAARELPVVTLLEYLRFLTQKWTYTNRNAAICTMTKLTSKAENDLRDNYAISLKIKASTSVTNVHNVFQIDEMPCPHTLAILSSLHLDPYQYCSKFFTKENLLAMYDGVVYPMPSQNNWYLLKLRGLKYFH
ncbi:protein FAR1-RELATED SEQUENCE 5-like [Mercurialis annua]|uniref:protein FAR1-RELATED SEQUENCE 5-like n=1 Tax=Mercurialis annua TaxID=3986 RepID=UPI00215F0F33|nr:protein FAR1-RELATED SEQUENCE 5-like [Mercurialis annua]